MRDVVVVSAVTVLFVHLLVSEFSRFSRESCHGFVFAFHFETAFLELNIHGSRSSTAV